MTVKATYFSLLLGLFAFVLMAVPVRAESDLERTWNQAKVMVPSPDGGKPYQFKVSSKKGKAWFKAHAGLNMPVVVYMHGCTGFGGNDKKVLRKLAAQGYVVIAPNSMARKYRPLQCSSWSQKGGANPFVFDFRQAEIAYALEQLWRADWADWDRMALVGVSEGGLAAAHYRGEYFRARVITQWTCHGTNLVRGISAPDDEPILAIVRKNDPWYENNPNQSGDCGDFFGDRPGSESVVLENGNHHDVMKDDAVINRITDFLDLNLSPRD